MRTFITIGVSALLWLTGAFAEKTLALKDLPPAVQKTVQEQLKGGEIKTISKEKEGGVTQYEVESMLNGKHRDFNIDIKGNLVVVEEETSIDSIPAAAKEAIIKKVRDGKAQPGRGGDAGQPDLLRSRLHQQGR
jgi:hypothetical protein